MDRRQVLKLGVEGLAAFAARKASAKGVSEVKIGAIYPLSGSDAQIGTGAKHALETAADIINNVYNIDLPGAKAVGLQGLDGAKVRLILADHQADPQRGQAEAERLITQDQVCAIIGAYHSSVSATVSEICERHKIPYLAADSSSPSLHRRYFKYFFRPAAHDEFFSAAMFDFLDAQKKAGKKIETIALFYEDTIFGSKSANIQRSFAQESAYKIVADIKYKANSPSLKLEVLELKSAAADVLLPSSYTEDALLLVKTMDESGYKPKNIIAQAAGFSDMTLFNVIGDRLVGLISRASFSLDLAPRRPSIRAVNDLFKKRANYDLNDNTSRQFMGLLIMADAINRAKSVQGSQIREALAATDIPGERTIMPWERVKFGLDGQNIYANPVLIQYIDKKFVTIFPKDVAVAEAKWPMNP